MHVDLPHHQFAPGLGVGITKEATVRTGFTVLRLHDGASFRVAITREGQRMELDLAPDELRDILEGARTLLEDRPTA